MSHLKNKDIAENKNNNRYIENNYNVVDWIELHPPIVLIGHRIRGKLLYPDGQALCNIWQFYLNYNFYKLIDF